MGVGSHPAGPTSRRPAVLVIPAAAVAVAAAVYLLAARHTPDYSAGLFGLHGIAATRLKAQIATGLLAAALLQVAAGLWLTGLLPTAHSPPRRLGRAHRALGIGLFAASIPVAVHCISAYGFETSDTRVAVHSVAGCLFYGAFTAKVLVVRSRRLPGWVLPALGAVLAALLLTLWYSAALWYFKGSHLP